MLVAANPNLAAPYIEAGRQALRELGYVEGQNITLEFRFASGQAELLPQFAGDLVRLKVDVLVVVGDRAVDAAKQATGTIPIVMVAAGDPVRSGFVSSLARPGGNITGLSSFLPELDGKLLGLLKEAVPRASRVAVLWNPRSRGGALGLKEMQAVAPGLGIALRSLEIQAPDEIERAISGLANNHVQALAVITDPLTFSQRTRILDLTVKHKLPAMFEVREFVNDGGLISYGPSLIALMRRSTTFVDKIIKGARPGDLPVEQPTRFELVVNLRTARAIGLTIPQSLLFRAADLIQ